MNLSPTEKCFIWRNHHKKTKWSSQRDIEKELQKQRPDFRVTKKKTRRMRDDLCLEAGGRSNYDGSDRKEEVESFRRRFRAQIRGPDG